MAGLKQLWVEKYRPSKIEDYVFQNPQHKASIMAMIEDKSIPHVLLAGVRGTGKTTLTRILLDAIGVDENDILEINASDESGVDTFRDRVKGFAETIAIGTFKVVYLEEADRLTPAAQKALKSFMEVNSDHVRFILTCNNINQIIIELRSRCQEFFFNASDINDVTEYAITVLASENIKFKLDVVDAYVATGFPDVRKIVNLLQQNSIGGVLQNPSATTKAAEYKFELLDMLAAGNWVEARKIVCANLANDEWTEFYRFLYDNLEKVPKFAKQATWEEAIVLVADYAKSHKLVDDPEINAAAMFIKLSYIK